MKVLRTVRNGLAGRKLANEHTYPSLREGVQALSEIDSSISGGFVYKTRSSTYSAGNISPSDVIGFIRSNFGSLFGKSRLNSDGTTFTHEVYSGRRSQRHYFDLRKEKVRFRIGKCVEKERDCRIVYSYLVRQGGQDEA